jgi:hypothetical protein
MLIAASTFLSVSIGIVWVILLVTLGLISIRKGHWIMFIIGLFIPIFWLIGALMPPTVAAAERGR